MARDVECADDLDRAVDAHAVAQGLGLDVVADTAHVPDHRLVKLPIVDFDVPTHAHVSRRAERTSRQSAADSLHTPGGYSLALQACIARPPLTGYEGSCWRP